MAGWRVAGDEIPEETRHVMKGFEGHSEDSGRHASSGTGPAFLSGTSNSSPLEETLWVPCPYLLGPPGKSSADRCPMPGLPAAS